MGCNRFARRLRSDRSPSVPLRPVWMPRRATMSRAPAESDAGGASREEPPMLQETLILVLSILPDWIALFLMVRDRYDKWKNARADDDGRKRGGRH